MRIGQNRETGREKTRKSADKGGGGETKIFQRNGGGKRTTHKPCHLAQERRHFPHKVHNPKEKGKRARKPGMD